MIIRTPTRTKTKSFKGDQMDFKFPSNESIHSGSKSIDLNNHYLLNESLGSQGKSAKVEGGLTVSSPILSDYTTGSNTNTNAVSNSSNGYYLFANISDNTTSPTFFQEQAHGEGTSSTHSDTVSLLHLNRPEKSATVSPENKRISLSHQNTIMSSIPENSIPNKTNTSIAPASNVSYDIISSRTMSHNNIILPSSSSSSSMSTAYSRGSLRKGVPSVKRTALHLYRKPSMKRVDSVRFPSDSTNGHSMGGVRKVTKNVAPLDEDKPLISSPSQLKRPTRPLKRSNAVKCKGGLLRYFELLGIRIKKSLNKLRIIVRRKLFSYNRSSSVPSSTKPRGKKLAEKKAKKSAAGASSKKLDELKKQNSVPYTPSRRASSSGDVGYVSKLKRSASQRMLKQLPVTPNLDDEPKLPEGTVPAKSNTLRRTNSSIRRAASILTASSPSTAPYQPSNPNLRNSYMDHSNGSGFTGRSSHLVKSAGSKSLNLLARQQSIVVKNKVIPLTMNRYPSADKSEKPHNDFEAEHDFAPIQEEEENDTRSVSSMGSSIFTDVKTHVDEPQASETVDEQDLSQMKSEMVGMLSEYLTQIIYKRIAARIQEVQWDNSRAAEQAGELPYGKFLDNLLSDYEDSEDFDSDASSYTTVSTGSDTVSTGSDYEESKLYTVPETAMPELTSAVLASKPLFGRYQDTLLHSSAVAASVHRSLTLPVGLTI
ncbi:Aim44p KNAG_0J01750 [Huiozyma naganishii CBS 8797]|uniref:Altered inheritance of mitochondria protein 44 n=1 Tax=Huiozyma naganishii (strain ATCC MYA-139 / BCRC 22969 / CBS 8797 / KCTC 17520 / NBRC 10181 / NCYC 3082 / Yp74L-3) TaxID=1071383 RepID=J7SAK6_HUIN7|nr:hypothetical protein KNAG_0J01750 [Kazachstania naganishii CBS 8797]CCK72256.1 hypothetical protein KNAG_0J01750 [Kazachstania naganishii CBS 8797]